ncbi:hypothetical protein HYX17_02295 [Candidatus Woesearchaeota archaeon]|nr:hypothetical protein [Candidatus Woesearchaeota archaeon]
MVRFTEKYKKEKINLLISYIKNKKEFSEIEDEFIAELLYNKINDKDLIKIAEHSKPEKSKEFKKSLKLIRKILHEVHGVFNIGKNRVKLLKELENEIEKSDIINEKIKNIHLELLKTHKSTIERINNYEMIYNKIFSILTPESILDLSSGLNPISFPWMNLDKVDYIATELNDNDVKFLNKYFSLMRKFRLNGKAINMNLLKIKKLPKTDICFIFKTLDSLETLKRGATKDILSKIKSKIIVISFPTKTLSGKNLSKRRLAWFNRLISDYSTFEIENEIFYIVNKTKLY